MEIILSPEDMQHADQTTIEKFKVPSLCLMERAALAVVDAIINRIHTEDKIVVLASSGNNGADGFAIARILYTRGYKVKVCFIGQSEKMTKEAKLQHTICLNYGLDVVSEADTLKEADILIDALFGIGLNRDVSGDYYNVIDIFNMSKARLKVAVDIPSGIDASNGKICAIACECDVTVTFNYKKIGHVLYPGKANCGQLHVADIGISDHSLLDRRKKIFSYNINDINLLPARSVDSNKGDYGKILIVAGNSSYTGACYLSAMASLRAGCGMVKVFTHENNKAYILDKLPEAMIDTYTDVIDVDKLIADIKWSNTVVIGPGLGRDEIASELVNIVIDNCLSPMVIDADALNIIAEDLSLFQRTKADVIITPHIGEMSRLKKESIEYIKNDSLSIAWDFAYEHDLICVLKSATTIIAAPLGNTYINQSGNSGMSTAGSGDVLCGFIAAMLGAGLKPEIAASLGVYLHGLCGDQAAKRLSKQAMLASDIIEEIYNVFKLKDCIGENDGR